MKNYIELSLYQLRKKSNILSIIIISISFFLIIILGTYYKTYNNLNTYVITSQDKTLELQNKKNPTPTKEEREMQMKELSSFNHIKVVTPSYILGINIKDPDIKFQENIVNFNPVAATNATLPDIVKGTNFPDNDGNYLICPENFYPTYNKKLYTSSTSNLGPTINLAVTKKDRMPQSEYFNKTVHYTYSNNAKTEEYSIDFKVIGLFKNKEYGVDETFCYANTKPLIEIGHNQIEKQYENIYGHFIEIDDIKNMEEVKKTLRNNGYYFEPITHLATDIIEQVNKTINTYIWIIICISFVFIFILLQSDYKKDKNYYQLLLYLGYTEKEIRKLYIISTLTKLLFCILISFIISTVLVLILHLIFIYYPFFLFKWKILYSYESVLLIIIASLIVVGILSVINCSKIKVS